MRSSPRRSSSSPAHSAARHEHVVPGPARRATIEQAFEIAAFPAAPGGGMRCVRMPALGAAASLAASSAVGVASDLASAPDDRARMLPVHPALAGLFPWGGLRRGTTVSVRGSTSLLFALLAPPTDTGSWAALVGMPDLGLRAAAELGVAVDRLALVRHPGRNLPAVVAALLDGMDLVA